MPIYSIEKRTRRKLPGDRHKTIQWIKVEEFLGGYRDCRIYIHTPEFIEKARSMNLRPPFTIRKVGSNEIPSTKCKLAPRITERSEKVVYLISDGECVKVGISNAPSRRLHEMQTAHPKPLSILHTWETRAAAVNIEKTLHYILKDYRAHGEWFLFKSPGQGLEIIQALIPKLDRDFKDHPPHDRIPKDVRHRVAEKYEYDYPKPTQ